MYNVVVSKIALCIYYAIVFSFFLQRPSKKGVGFGPVTILAWYGINSKVVMAIWKMARDQHVFYRQRRANKVGGAGACLSAALVFGWESQ